MKKTVEALALAGVLAVGLNASAVAADDSKAEANNMEKCYGVVKAGMNDCGSAQHSCAGQAKMDGAQAEWVYVPTGTCMKLVNGSVTAPAADDSNDSNDSNGSSDDDNS